MSNLLIVNLDGTAAIEVNEETNSLTIVTDGGAQAFAMPEDVLLLKDGEAICTFKAGVSAEELMKIISPPLVSSPPLDYKRESPTQS